MKRRKKGRRQQPKPVEIRSKLAIPPGYEATRAPYGNDQEGPKGIARACATLESFLRPTPPREILQNISRLIRSRNDRGSA
jgi:Rad3-related DNA helicase